MKTLSPLLFTLLWSSCAISQSCNEDSIVIKSIRASDTDPNITWEAKQHIVLHNPTCNSKNTLVINLIGTDPFGTMPLTNFLTFPSVAANNGFHVISIKYKNNDSEAIKCANSGDIECYENYHIENLYGQDSLSSINIDTSECILNRIEKLLQYLSSNYPSESWNQFLSGDNVNWSEVIVAGHSQGGSHAAFIAHEFTIKRALLFASPFEYNNNFLSTAPWVSTFSQTPDSNLYAFSNLYDEVSQFQRQYLAWSSLGIINHGDTVNVDASTYPYENTRLLYTKDTSTIGTSFSAMHGSVYTDSLTFYDGFGVPIYKPVWEYMLGIDNSPSIIGESINSPFDFRIFPNPANSYLYFESSCKIKLIQISNLLGEICFAKLINTSTGRIDISALNNGYYTVLVNGESGFKIEKLVIK